VGINQSQSIMSAEQTATTTVLTYFAGRGMAESIRLLLALVKEPWVEVHMKTREQFLKLRDEEAILEYGHLPMLEYRGQRLFQSQAILRYVASLHGLYGSTPEERYQVDAANDTAKDLFAKIAGTPWIPLENRQTHLETVLRPAIRKFLPYLERRLQTREWLAGPLSFADVTLFECFCYLNDFEAHDDLQAYPNVIAHAGRFSQLVKDYLESPQRHGWPDATYMTEVRTVLQF
jgi:glutathione S-transferase